MPLDLQPVEDSLDLQPVGEALDLRPVLSDSEQSQVANLKSEIARNLAESNKQSRRAQVLDYTAQLIDVPAALKAAINLPQRLTGQPDLPPLLSEDQARGLRESAADFYSRNLTSGTTPQPRFNLVSPDVQTQLAQGVGKGVDQLVSGLTAPENLAALAVAPRFPTQVGAVFAGQMLGEVPQSIEAIAEAQTPQEKATAAVGATANLALGGLTTGGLIKSKLRPAPREILDLRKDEHPAPPEAPSEFGGIKDLPPEPPLDLQPVPSTKLSLPTSSPNYAEIPLSTIELKYLTEDTRAGKPVPAALVDRAEGFALPEGYKLTGDQYVYEEPPKAETEAARMARENREAMEALRAAKEAEPFVQAPVPAQFDTVEDLLDFRETRLKEERELYQREIGLTTDEARILQNRVARDGDTTNFEKKLTPEKRAAFTKFFDESPYNKVGGPFEFWETDQRLNPEDSVHETNKGLLASTIVTAAHRGIEQAHNSDRFLSAAIAAKRLKELGGTQSDIARYADQFSSRESSSQGDKAFFFKELVEKTGAFLRSQGIELPEGDLGGTGPKPAPKPRELEAPDPVGERPYDILDWIEGNYPQGVRTSNPADFGEYVKQARGRAKELLSNVKGERADRVLEEAHNQGEWRRLESEDDLHAAIVDAGEARIAWRERARKVEKWADETIAQGKKRLAAGLDPELLTAYAVKGAAHIARGVRDFAAWSAEMLTEFGEAIRPHLETVYRLAADQPGLRQAVAKIQVDPTVSQPVKDATLPDFPYTVRTHQMLDQQAQQLIQQHGVDAMFQAYQARTLPGDLAERLKQQLIERARQGENQARVAGNANAEAQAQQRQVDLWTSDAYGTDVAQALAARQTFGDMSAGAHLRHARETFAKAGDAKAEEILNPHVPNVLEELRAGHGEAIDALRQDESTNQTARAAVDHTIATSDTTHAAVVMELAGEWSQSPHILSTAREAVRAKANELLNIRPRPAGLTAPAHLRQILDDLAARAADIAASHYQGAEEGKTLTQKLQQRLGLTEDKAGALAKRLDEEFKKQVESAAKQLPKRIARQRVALGKNLPADAAEPIVDRAIREQLRQHNLQLGNLLEKTAAEVDQAGRTIGERIVADSGLTGEAANKLRDAINRRYEILRTEAQRRRLEALAKRIPLPGQLRRQFDKLLKWARLGAFDEKSLRDQLAQGMGIPSLTDEIAREIVRRSTEIDRTPEGFQRDRKSTELLNYIARMSGRKWWELPMAVWYANALSGPTTHLVNSISNLANLSSNVAITISRQPLATPQILAALARGGAKGLQEATAAMQTGQVPTEGFRKLQESRLLENIQLPGKLDYLLTPWRAVGRALAAEDLIFFKSAQEMRAAVAARSLARTEGLHGSSLTRRTFEILALDDGAVAVAKAQAAAEGLKGLDYRRRVSEIIEQSRPISLRQNAIDYALQVTFNQEPGGVAGRFARALTELNRQVPAARFVVPFVNIVVNVANEGLNYAPGIGAAKAIWGHWKGSMDGKPATAEALYDQWAKQVIGTTLLAGLAYAHAQGALQVTGSGPRTREQRDQLKETGWIPNSIKIGDRYYSFANAPAAIPLSILGNYLDAIKYKGLDQQDALNRSAYALQQSGHVLLQATPLDSLRTFFDLWNTDSPRRAGASLAQYTARTAGNFVIPNALRQIDRLFDPTVYDAPTVHAGLVSQVPFARRENRPAINVLGQPIRTLVEERFTKAETPDPLWRAIAEKGAWIPTPNRDVIVGEKARGPEYYRTLTPDEWYEYIRESGLLIRTYLDPVEIRTMEPEKAKAYVHRVAEEQRRKVLKTFSR
jgi:hypothetical protein